MARMVVPNGPFLTKVREILAEGHQCTIRTKGSSMLPFIWGERDSVVLEKFDDVAVDDIVLAYVQGRGYILHRIVRIDGDDIFMMGDGNLKYGEHCTKADIAGTVVWIERDSDRLAGAQMPQDADELEAFRRSHPESYVDPHGPEQLKKAHLWRRLQPFRRILLAVYRRTFMKFGSR